MTTALQKKRPRKGGVGRRHSYGRFAKSAHHSFRHSHAVARAQVLQAPTEQAFVFNDSGGKVGSELLLLAVRPRVIAVVANRQRRADCWKPTDGCDISSLCR